MREKWASASGRSRHPPAGEAGIRLQEKRAPACGRSGHCSRVQHLHGNAGIVAEYIIYVIMQASAYRRSGEKVGVVIHVRTVMTGVQCAVLRQECGVHW